MEAIGGLLLRNIPMEWKTKIEYEHLIGRPFLYKGRTVEGFDCLGLILYVLRENGFRVDDPCAEYPPDWAKNKNHNYFIENYHKQWEKVSEPKLLDVVLFGSDKHYPTHAGIIVARNIFIHCSDGHGVITSRLNRVREQINGFYRLKQNADNQNHQ